MPAAPVNQGDFKKCDEVYDTRKGTPLNVQGNYHRSYVRTFLVFCSNIEAGASYVAACNRLPPPNAIYQNNDGSEYDELAILVRYEARRLDKDGLHHWLVDCHYSTEVPEEGVPTAALLARFPTGVQNMPWLRPAVVKWDWEETTYAPPTDLDGRSYVNSAKQPFSPPPTFPVARNVLVVERNERRYDRLIASRYAFAVNADVFMGAQPGCVLCMPIRATVHNLGTLQFYRTTYRLKFGLPKRAIPMDRTSVSEPLQWDKIVADLVPELQSWQPEIIDQGFCRLQRIGPFIDRPVPIFRPGGQVTQPVLLDGTGQEARPNGSGKIVPKLLKFRQFHSADFARILTTGVF